MANPIFKKLQEAYDSNPKAFIDRLGYEVKEESQGWLRTSGCPSCKCEKPLLSWFETTGNVFCQKCQFKTSDIVTTFAAIQGIETGGRGEMTKAAQACADFNGVKYTKFDPDKAKDFRQELPADMTEEILASAQKRLLSDEGEDARHFIMTKWKVDPEDLVDLGVGLWKDKRNGYVLVIATYDDQTGALCNRYKRQLLKKPRAISVPMRSWTKGTGPTPRLWPSVTPTDPDLVESYLIVEGESDLITARCRMKLEETGVYPVAVFGKSGGPDRARFPEAMVGKPVTILMDIDAFQGPLDKIQGTDKDKSAVKKSTLGSIRNLARVFRERNCEVSFSTVSGKRLDPVKHPKGDLTDWVNAGGRSLSELKSWTYDEIFGELDTALEIPTVGEAMKAPPEQLISLTGTVGQLEKAGLGIPTRTFISCRVMDESVEKACLRCGVPSRIGVERTQEVHWDQFPQERARALMSDDPDMVVVKDVCQKASGCSLLSVSHSAREAGTRWVILDVHQSGETSSDAMDVVSAGKPPSIVGRVKVTGRVYQVRNKPVLIADHVEDLDANTVDIRPLRDELLHGLKHSTNDVDVLWNQVVDIAQCVSDHLTKIRQLEDVHIGTLLTLCSSLRYLNEDGQTRRGWMDITIMGVSRTGKSTAIATLFDKLEMGLHSQASASGASIAGLTTSSADLKNVKPGTWPKHHGRCIALDEMQNFFGHPRSPIRALQSARSDGVIDSAKCTGDARLPAAVRAIFISNFPLVSMQYRCHGLLPLYEGELQGIARTDFAILVNESAKFGSKDDVYGVPNKYRLPVIKVLAQRAWSQTPQEVKISPEAYSLAHEICKKWDGLYEKSELPLYSGFEKAESVMRIAIAVANLTFSHDTEDETFRTVEVRRVHVEFAIRWLEHTWSEAQYDLHSAAIMRRNTVSSPVQVSARLTSDLEAEDVEATLSMISSPGEHRDKMATMPGNDFREQAAMLNFLVKKKVLTQIKDGKRTLFHPTTGGKALLDNIARLAIEHPLLYDEVRQQWQHWSTPGFLGGSDAPNLATYEDYELFLMDKGHR